MSLSPSLHMMRAELLERLLAMVEVFKMKTLLLAAKYKAFSRGEE
tara:strand:- start:116 stop:250 length:135 start_codon:yes stop_codon:yes gene_type:complete